MYGMTYEHFGSSVSDLNTTEVSRNSSGVPIPPCGTSDSAGYVNNAGDCIIQPDAQQVDSNGNPITWVPPSGYFRYPHDFMAGQTVTQTGSINTTAITQQVKNWVHDNPLLAIAVAAIAGYMLLK